MVLHLLSSCTVVVPPAHHALLWFPPLITQAQGQQYGHAGPRTALRPLITQARGQHYGPSYA